jgi:hypothetical protein
VLNALSKDEYLATFVEPMRRLEPDEMYKPVPLGDPSSIAFLDQKKRD